MFPWETIFEIAQKKSKVAKIESELKEDSFWQQNAHAQDTFRTLNQLKRAISSFESLGALQEDIEVMIELVQETGEDASAVSELTQMVTQFDRQVQELELKALLSGPYDQRDCIMSLNAGAGGTDAQDWTEMLVRMYTRWMETHGFSYEIVESTMGEEAGIKSLTMIVHGDYAYGYLKHESGIHRLVRLSPFNANHKRQTSFAAVDVVPEIAQDADSLEIDPKDLKIDTFRASGAGGQHVNKTDSAVRITHLPTQLVAVSQNSRSQTDNKATAMAILISRLRKRMEDEHKEKIQELRHDVKDISWGHQKRSYVFHPYTLVKDHDTSIEDTQVKEVMDGRLDPFIFANLRTPHAS